MSPEEDRYSVFESAFEGLTGMRMDPAQGKLMVKKEMRRFPLGLEGGGIQTSANLLYDMLIRGEQSSIFAIEEPETHVHPELQRKLSREFGKIARERQVFVATHSPSFLSMEEESRIWLLRLTRNETEVTPISTEKLRTNPGEIELRPGDLLFSNKIVLVEGKSDRIVLEAFAERLGIDLMNIELVPIHGKSRSSGTLEAWIGLMKNIVPVYFILDPESQSELNEAINKRLADKASAHVWRAGPIEKYYPLAILSESLGELNKRYSLGLDIGKVMKKIQSRDIQPDKIEIGSSKRERLDESWDVLLAEEVAKRIRSGSVEVADEVAEALTNASALPPRE
jgi:predicted ATP-dependent endonuclease of OLD family